MAKKKSTTKYSNYIHFEIYASLVPSRGEKTLRIRQESINRNQNLLNTLYILSEGKAGS